MKWLAPVLLLLLAPFATATNYTATNSGDWGDSSVWSPSGVPQMSTCTTCNAGGPNGDTVTISDSYTISCGPNETCSVGNSPSTNASVVSCTHGTGAGGLAIAPGATFIYAGRVQLCAGTITLGAGAKIQYDSSWSSASTTVNYSWDFTTPASYVPVWLVSGTSGSHAVIEGDSFYASTKNSGACTSANSCLAGAFNHDGGNAYYNNEGQGTISYLDIQDVQGSAVNTHGNAAWVTAVKTGSNSAFDHITVTNSATMVLIETASASVGLTVNGLAITNSRYTLPPSSSNPGAMGCLDIKEFSTTAAVFSINNAYMDCSVDQLSTSAQFGVFTWRNVEMYRSANGVNPGLYAGLSNGGGVSSTDLFDEYYVYPAIYNTGSVQTNVARPLVPVFALINSILWSPKTSLGGAHIQTFTANIQSLPASGDLVIKNNIWGSMGVNTGSGLQQLTTSISFTAPSLPRNANLIDTGNVMLCDQWGYSSIGFAGGRWTAAVATHILTETIEQNTACSAVIGGPANTNDTSGSEGAIGFEGPVTQANFMSADSNLFWNPSNLFVPEVCGSDNTNFDAPNQPMLILTNNAVANTTTTSPAICNDGGAGNASQWVVTGPQNDITMLNHLPVMVDGRRSPITFDIDYLIPSGTLGGVVGQSPATYWAAQTGWRGAWASSTSYAVSDLVSDMQTGLWGSKTTYWRCIQSHLAATINRPATGVDPANIFLDQAAYWEPAYMQFFRQQVYLGTVFYEGSVPQLTDINGNPEPMHMIGFLNAWLRQGMTSMEPQLWNGCLNARECGAIQRTAIQHIPPPAAVN